MTALFLDSAVWAYALGEEHPRREACRALLLAAQQGRFELHASVELVQEVVFHRLRRTDRTTAVAEGRAIELSCTLHPFDATVLDNQILERGFGPHGNATVERSLQHLADK